MTLDSDEIFISNINEFLVIFSFLEYVILLILLFYGLK